MCQAPMSCLVTQSSSDCGSGGSGSRMSEASQRTAYTTDANHKRGSSFLQSLMKKKPNGKTIARYIKKDNENKKISQVHITIIPSSSRAKFMSTMNNLPLFCPAGKRQLNRKNSCSAGDVSLIARSILADPDVLSTGNKRSLSCLDISDSTRNTPLI